jgi:TBC1 domain family protein 5
MRAPDGSYEEGLIIPGLSSSPPRTNATTANLSTNNPLSLDVEVHVHVQHMDVLKLIEREQQNPWKEWFAAIDLRRTIRQDVERT